MKGCLIIVIVLFAYALIFGDNMGDAIETTLLALSITILVFLFVAAIKAIMEHDESSKKHINERETETTEETHSQNDTASAVDDHDDAQKANDVENDEPRQNPIVVRLTLLQFQGIERAVKRGLEFCKRLSIDDDLRTTFFKQAVNSAEHQTYSADDFFSTLRFFFANDLFYCFNHLGHPVDKIAEVSKDVAIDYQQSEGQALFATLSTLSDSGLNYQMFREEVLSMNRLAGTQYDVEIRKTVENMLPIYLHSGASISAEGVDDFNMVLLLRSFNKEELIPDIRQIYYDFAEAVALSDDDKDGAEAEWLGELKEKIMTKSIPQQPAHADDQASTVVQEQESPCQPESQSYTTPMKQLDALIGLRQVKTELQTLTRFIEVNQKRREAGLRVASISYHCVFAGNPGTGKTTVARILAGIYKQLGILEKGQLVETDRSGLVAEYVGQTAVKTNKIIDKALGGVLFIDEAYTLAQGGEQDYGKEAIATLLKRMEDDRDRLVVILAGYTQEIEQFIRSNPGLRSRFNRYIHFEDYTEDELFQIFLLQAKKYDYKLDAGAEAKLNLLLRQKVTDKQKDFGNARFVRNLFEKVIENQAVRLSRSGDISKANLTVITQEDIFE